MATVGALAVRYHCDGGESRCGLHTDFYGRDGDGSARGYDCADGGCFDGCDCALGRGTHGLHSDAHGFCNKTT